MVNGKTVMYKPHENNAERQVEDLNQKLEQKWNKSVWAFHLAVTQRIFTLW